MARVDLERFPLLIIEIPVDQFPENGDIKITMRGRKINTEDTLANRTSQLAVELLPGNIERLTSLVTWTSSDFVATSPDGQRRTTRNLKMPFNEVQSVTAYARRDDPEDNTPISVNMYTTTSGGLKSARGTTTNLEGVWAFQMTLTKQDITPAYATDFFVEATDPGQITGQIGALVTEAAQIVAGVLVPSLPSPKALAAKFLGPAAAPIQAAIATITDTIAKYKPIVDTTLAVATAVSNISQSIASGNLDELTQYLPVVWSFAFEIIPQENLSKVIYDFRSGS